MDMQDWRHPATVAIRARNADKRHNKRMTAVLTLSAIGYGVLMFGMWMGM